MSSSSSSSAAAAAGECYLPLRWESTGEQWWYASPIDCAAANGHYELVRELLRIDPNLLIKLTSLRRIRRLETVWDDDPQFAGAPAGRALIARRLLAECDSRMRDGSNALIRAGYGGWLLYTAASAGDMDFARELLDGNPLLVFGEGEYGVTDMLYAAARCRRPGGEEVFMLLLDAALPATAEPAFREEMVNRAVHAAARGGNVGVLTKLLDGCSDVSAYRDAHGSTVLHSAAGRGQVEAVKHLVGLLGDVDGDRDDQGNTALHVAAFFGHLAVVEALVAVSPAMAAAVNAAGDTFLQVALAGFRTTGFRRVDRQTELIKKLVAGAIVDIAGVVNVRNNDGRTALHLAVLGNVHVELVKLLMAAPAIDVNVCDSGGMTPLDMLKQQPQTASSELLIRQLVSAGGMSMLRDDRRRLRTAIAAQKIQSVAGSPGVSFRISDAEMFSYSGRAVLEPPKRLSSFSKISETPQCSSNAESNPVGERRGSPSLLKAVMKWPRRKEKKPETAAERSPENAASSMKSGGEWWPDADSPTTLREQFAMSMPTSLPNSKRVFAVPQPKPNRPTSGTDAPSCSNASVMNSGKAVGGRGKNQYFCFGTQGIAVEGSVQGNSRARSSPPFIDPEC